jgi:hypothetical protein
VTIAWKRKGPKGCYRAVHEGRIVLLERAKTPAEMFWLLHRADGKGGIVSDTLYAETVENAWKTAEATLAGTAERVVS